MKYNYKAALENVTEQAQEVGLFENAFFLSTFQSYIQNVKYLQRIVKEINNGEADISEYRKQSQICMKNALCLFQMLGDEKNELALRNKLADRKMPDFNVMPPKQLRQWCKKYDIDYDDFAKDYLLKALEKRWTKENGRST